MLKPQANAIRELVSLDGVWNFALEPSTQPDPKAWEHEISSRLQVPVPASYNDIFLDSKIRDHNTPFEADITNVVSPGEQFRLTVAVSNELDWTTIPPGRIETRDGKHKQHYQHDFFHYFGLARSVWLCCVPETHVNDVTVASDVTDGGDSGVVNFKIGRNQLVPDSRTEVSISDEEGNLVGQTHGLSGKLAIDSAKLWQPGAAYLYQLRIRLLDESGGVADAYQLPVGVRSVRLEGNRFLINGKPFYFSGFGKHEDAPVWGKGHDAACMIHDFELMKWMGASSFRATHYPYAEEVMEYADRHGFVVIGETAAVGLNLAVVAGLHGAKQLPTYSPDTVSEETRKSHEQAIRELIARDKYHPSVVMWAIANEPAAHEPGAREYFEPLVSLARQLDSRPLCYANEFQASADKCLISDLFDVLCLNRYYHWYLHTGDPETAEKGLETELLGWQAKFGKPIIMSEYGADTLAGLHTVGDVPWGKEYQSRVLEMSHRVFDRVDSVVGEHVWNLADFQTPSTFIFRVDGNKKGVLPGIGDPKWRRMCLRSGGREVERHRIHVSC